jgi:propanediol dehydratase large subunit
MIDPKDIQEAREILGKDAAGMTDAQIAEIITGLDTIADMVIDCYIEQRRKPAKSPHEKSAA